MIKTKRKEIKFIFYNLNAFFSITKVLRMKKKCKKYNKITDIKMTIYSCEIGKHARTINY